MKLVEFPEQTAVFAHDQPEYLPLPAHVREGFVGEITCCWKFTWRERLKLLWTGRIWHKVLTFNEPLQPQLLLVDKPDFSVPSVVSAKDPR